MLNVALFGPPGAGKGTQSASLVEEFNLFYISTGDLLRKEIAAETKLGLEAKSIIASGGLVSDEIIVQVIEKTITEHPEANGFLFDGFPRTYIQCYILEGLMLKLNTSLSCLICLEVNEETSVRRLLERGRTSGRTDDNETVIRAIIRDELVKHLVNVVVFGYPGSGRGSQSASLARKYGLEYVATGPLLDQEIKAGTPIGRKIVALYESGQLVPDEIVVQLIEKKLERSREVKGFIFKGFPRTLVQSYILDGLLRKVGSSVSRSIEIQVPMLELIKRLDERSRTERCMPYDNATAKIVQRLAEHETKTVPVIEKYSQLHGVVKVDGMGSFEEVFERTSGVLESLFRAG